MTMYSDPQPDETPAQKYYRLHKEEIDRKRRERYKDPEYRAKLNANDQRTRKQRSQTKNGLDKEKARRYRHYHNMSQQQKTDIAVKRREPDKARNVKQPWIYMAVRAKQRARRNGYPCTIDATYLHDIWPKDNTCPVLGIELEVGDNDRAPSLDKIVPELGYVPGNVVIISNKANRMKSNSTVDEIRRLYEYYCR